MADETLKESALPAGSPACCRVKIDLQFADGSKPAREIVAMYLSERLDGDLDQLVYNLNDGRTPPLICSVSVENWEIKTSDDGGCRVEVELSFSEGSRKAVEEMLEEYLGAFEDYIRDTVMENRSRTGKRSIFDWKPESWSVEFPMS